MTIPKELDYTGLSEPTPMENPSSSSTVSRESEKSKDIMNLKETELTLSLPGSDFLERKSGTGISLFGKDLKDEGKNGGSQISVKSFVSGSKRGFSEAIDGSGKWGFCMKGGAEVDLRNGGSEDTKNLQSCLPGPSVKEIGNPTSEKPVEEKKSNSIPASKAQVVGWPPIRSFRKNNLATNLSKPSDVDGKLGLGCLFVKVSMDGAPYLRKVDLKTYCSYAELSSALEKMFSCFTIGQYAPHGLPGKEHLRENCLKDLLHGSEYVLTYEDKDGDWMLVGDVPWEMFTDSCKRLRIMKGSVATGLAPRAMQKCKSQK